MKRSIVVCALVLSTTIALSAQQASRPDPYKGASNPPPDDTITTQLPETAPIPKPPAGHPASAATQTQRGPQTPAANAGAHPTSVDPTMNYRVPGTGDPGADDGIVMIAPDAGAQPALSQRTQINGHDSMGHDSMNDPDGDIVHPAPLLPGELGQGTTIRAQLLDRLSTAYTVSGETFRTTVASDVLQDGKVLIPAGAEIDGSVVSVSTGHTGGHGSMLLRPETVIMADGSHFRLYAQITAAPGSGTRVGDEGAITPGSRLKKDGIEYGGAAGTGLVAGAILGGPAGAVAGTLIGAGAVTVHLLVDHPQATLNAGTMLVFTLTEPLNLVPANAGMAPASSSVDPASSGMVPAGPSAN